jgi:hypothetical protein
MGGKKMTLKQKIKDYLSGRLFQRVILGNNYWIGYERRGLLYDLDIVDPQNYDGKYMVNRTFDEIDRLVPSLVNLLKKKKICCFKHKSRVTPIQPQYQDRLPPVFIYLHEKDRKKIDSELDKLGLEDRVWINDTRRTEIDFMIEHMNMEDRR